MPKDIAGAVAELATGDTAAPSADAAEVEQSLPPAVSEQAPAITPSDTAAAPKETLDVAKERLEAIREKRRAAKEKMGLDAHKRQLSEYEASVRKQYEDLQAKQRQVDDLEQKWKAALKDPLKFTELGHNPLDLYKKITAAAAEADTPEGHAARIREEFESKLAEKDKALEAVRAEFAELKKLLETDQSTRSQEREVQLAQERTSRFFDILKLDKYQDLTDFYGDEELVAMANAWHDPNQGPIDPQAAADAVLTWFEGKDQRRATRRKEREAAKTGAAGQPAGDSQATEQRPATIGNAVAAATASAPAPRKRTREERHSEAADELSVFLASKRGA